jgi:hypothetical protein
VGGALPLNNVACESEIGFSGGSVEKAAQGEGGRKSQARAAQGQRVPALQHEGQKGGFGEGTDQ